MNTLLTKNLLMVTGKGGTGKTLLALALAQQAAGFGKKVLLVESHYMGKVASIWPEINNVTSGLTLLNLSYADTFRDFVNQEFSKNPLVKKLFQADFLRKFLSSIPGFNELLFLGELVQFAKKKNFDLVVYDGFASGHFHSLLRTPAGIAESGIGGRVGEEAAKIHQYIIDETRVAIVMASILQPLVMIETVEFANKFSKIIKPEQLVLAVRKPLSAYCKLDGHSDVLRQYLNAVMEQAATAEKLLQEIQNPDQGPLWLEDIGGMTKNKAPQVHKLLFSQKEVFI